MKKTGLQERYPEAGLFQSWSEVAYVSYFS